MTVSLDMLEAIRSLKASVADLRRIAKQPKEDVLLTERRVQVISADELAIIADVRGDEATYRVSIYAEGNLTVRECSCPHGQMHPTRGGCSHTKAVDKVRRVPPE